ncbi:MAG: hypothetical protein U0X75_04955 [Acidobacteriota bacterium]
MIEPNPTPVFSGSTITNWRGAWLQTQCQNFVVCRSTRRAVKAGSQVTPFGVPRLPNGVTCEPKIAMTEPNPTPVFSGQSSQNVEERGSKLNVKTLWCVAQLVVP